MLKIATWNVNSLRVRLPHVLTWLATNKPDVLAVQEIKLLDADFPIADLEAAGYKAIVSGQKTYNGVAFLIRKETIPKQAGDIIRDIPGYEDVQRRVLGIAIDDIRIINLYVPNGESTTSPKYQYKLSWLAHLRTFLQMELARYPKLIILGDFNIAPEGLDVDDPKRWEGKVLFTELERQVLRDLTDMGFNDCFRILNPQQRSFSWWDYRSYAFKPDMGLRIDHILASPGLQATCSQCYIDKAPRDWERPSDHAPVIAEFSLI